MLNRAKTSSHLELNEVNTDQQIENTSQESGSLYANRKKRFSKTPSDKRVPGFDISHTTTEKLELLVSLNLNNDPLAKNLRIKAAHELATRYIEGSTSEKEHKAPHDQLKAYMYAEKEINSYTIKELEDKFFQIEVAGNNINIAKFWSDKAKRWRKPLERNENNGHTIFYNTKQLFDTNEIDNFINQAEWNGLLKKEKARNANAILVAWEKQLIATRLANHYRKLKKEKRDIETALIAKFYKRLVQQLKDHEPPESHISTILKKISPRFNQIRLFLSRAAKVISVVYHALPDPIKWTFNILSLYFLIPFLIDLAIVIKEGPAAFWEDNRPSRMANDGVWFALNFTCLMLGIFLTPVAPVLGPLLIAAITVAGFVFDVGAESAIGIYAYKNQQATLDNIDNELKKLNHIDVEHRFTHDEIKNFPEGVALKKQYIEQKLALLETRQQLLNKRKELYINRAYTIAIMAILATCAVFIFFPFAALPAAPLIAAITALTVGSIFGGLGKHIFWNVIMDTEFHATCKEKFWAACKWVKELFVEKVKIPFKGSQNDSSITYRQYTSTRHIDGALERTNSKKVEPEIISDSKPATNRSQNKTALSDALHHSSSGLLMLSQQKHTPVQKISSSNPEPTISLNNSVGQI